MNAKKCGWLFLSTVLFEFAVMALLLVLDGKIQMGIIESLLVSQLIVLVPACIFLIFTREKITNLIAMRKPKISTSLLVIVLTGLCMPLITTVNAISMLFVDNEVTALSAYLTEVPKWQVLLVVGIVGPICEEFVFRGIFYHGFRKSGRFIGAIVWSALLFGLTHMNFNQMSYAFVVGIIGAFLVEGCGSIIYSMLMHICINLPGAMQMVFMDLGSQMDGRASRQYIEQTMKMPYEQALCVMISVLSIVALVSTTLAVCLFCALVKKENRVEHMQMILHPKQKTVPKNKLVSVPLILGVIICLGYMILDVCMAG